MKLLSIAHRALNRPVLPPSPASAPECHLGESVLRDPTLGASHIESCFLCPWLCSSYALHLACVFHIFFLTSLFTKIQFRGELPPRTLFQNLPIGLAPTLCIFHLCIWTCPWYCYIVFFLICSISHYVLSSSKNRNYVIFILVPPALTSETQNGFVIL